MSVSKTSAAHVLGGVLKTTRKANGLTLRALEERTGISNALISMWENGHRLPIAQQLDTVLDQLAASDEQREQLHGLLREAAGPGEIAPGSPVVGEQLAQLIDFERRAVKITSVEPLLIPGLLQTREYADAILGSSAAATLRTGRGDILTKSDPAELIAAMDSEVLTRPIAPPPVMLNQLRHLLKMTEMPNVSIQVWSSTRAGWHPGLMGPYMLLEYAASSPIVHLEHYSSAAFIWEAADVKKFTEAAQTLRRDVAMTPARSAEVIAEIVHGMETTI